MKFLKIKFFNLIKILFVVCFLILFFGRYVILEDIIKLISSLLLLSTLSAFIMVLWPPRSLHDCNSWFWNSKSCQFNIFQEASIRISTNGVCYDSNWCLRFCCLGPSYVYRWYVCYAASLFYACNNGYSGSYRDKNFFMDCNNVGRIG